MNKKGDVSSETGNTPAAASLRPPSLPTLAAVSLSLRERRGYFPEQLIRLLPVTLTSTDNPSISKAPIHIVLSILLVSRLKWEDICPKDPSLEEEEWIKTKAKTLQF